MYKVLSVLILGISTILTVISIILIVSPITEFSIAGLVVLMLSLVLDILGFKLWDKRNE